MTNTTVRIALQRVGTTTDEFAAVQPGADRSLYISVSGAVTLKEAVLLAEAIRIMAREQEATK